MLKYVVGVCLLLVILIPSVMAAIEDQQTIQNVVVAQTDQANRFLSAEVSKQIKAEQEAIIKQVNDNNDANFQMLDVRTSQMMADTKQRVIIGGIGAILVANAIVALFLMRAWRRYSFEYYQQQIIKKQGTHIKVVEDELKELKERTWNIQTPVPTYSDVVGQAQAMDMSQMNQWQLQPAYAGSWAPPREEVEQEQKTPWGGKGGG
jgi:hypothetical protein